MNCSDAQELLSAFYDGQLPEERRAQVAAHLQGCSACSEELAGFRRLSEMTLGLATPAPPDSIWQDLERALDEDETVQPAAAAPRPTRRRAVRQLALAATLLVAVGAGYLVYRTWFGPPQHHGRDDVFARYLETFHRSPDEAQQQLVASYASQRVDVRQAARQLGYTPTVARGLPEGYQLTSAYVLKMPCCTCMQTVCQRADGSTLAIFEHDDENPQWFGERPQRVATCNGTQCVLCNVDNRIAASWTAGRRHITLIGAQDEAEVERLVAWLAG